MSSNIRQRIEAYIQFLERYADRFWYPPIVGVLACIDNLLVLIPTDGILISSTMLTPRRWFFLGLATAIGSTVGAGILAFVVEAHGLPLVLEWYPGIEQTQAWQVTNNFFDQYGLLVVFAIAATPFFQQPSIIIASLAATPLPSLIGTIFLGRALKFLVLAYIGSHAPKLLKKVWGIRSELKISGVDLEQK